MQTITIPANRLVKAQGVSGWSMSLFGSPKLTIICGGCYRPFATRDYIPFKGTGHLTACCSYCEMWNNTGLVRS